MLKIFENEHAVAEQIAKEMEEGLSKASPVYCLAAGSTPAKGYDLFARRITQRKVNLDHLKIVSLDEWVGVPSESEGSCFEMLRKDLFAKIPIGEKQITFFDGMVHVPEEECQRIDNFIKKNPITFSLMGVGVNGHIGLNEPGFPVLDHSCIVELSDTTKCVAQKYFEGEAVLEDGITLGLAQIIASDRVIVVVTGSHKAAIVKEIFSKAGARLPASYLLGHGHIDFYLDKEAAKYLNEKEVVAHEC